MSTLFSGYKKLIVTLVSTVAVFLVPVLNKKYGVNLDATTVAITIGSIVSVALGYITAEFKLDKARAEGPVNPALIAAVAALVQFAPEDKRADLQKLLSGLV